MVVAKTCSAVGTPRVTGIAIDPLNQRTVWVALGVDGVRRSTDLGETWSGIDGTIPNPDVHNVAVASGPPKTVVMGNNDVYTSTDDGATWWPVRVWEVFPWTDPRGIMVQLVNAKVIFLAIGDSPPGPTGTVMHSELSALWADSSHL